jgi:hypothetical protein
MSSIIDCPSCNRKLQVPDELLSRQVKCPTCGETFTARASANGAATEASDREEPAPRPSTSRPARRVDDEDDYDDRPSRRRLRRNVAPHRGTLILILGILALVPIHGMTLTLILGPIAWIMGNSDLKEMRAGRMDPEGESQTSIGRICGMIATILGGVGLVIGLLFFCLWLAVIIGIFGAAASH